MREIVAEPQDLESGESHPREGAQQVAVITGRHHNVGTPIAAVPAIGKQRPLHLLPARAPGIRDVVQLYQGHSRPDLALKDSFGVAGKQPHLKSRPRRFIRDRDGIANDPGRAEVTDENLETTDVRAPPPIVYGVHARLVILPELRGPLVKI